MRFLVLLFILWPLQSFAAHAQDERVRVAVLDFGDSETGRRAADRVATLLARTETKGALKLALLDRDLSRAAARGTGYKGSLNMTLAEARNLGAAIGCDFIITGDAQSLRRSSSTRPAYYEAYASVFIVSARTGRLVSWERPVAEASTPDEATSALLIKLDERVRARYHAVIIETLEREQRERRTQMAAAVVSDADAPETPEVINLEAADAGELQGRLREPAPYRRLRPAYPETAAQAEAEATVDASVEIGADGEVSRVEIVRWAGFGLDESVISTVRQLHFRPAERDGTPVAVRVLLRYNFRRPAKRDEPGARN